ncbi:MAG: septum formation initiator family protein [Chthoniobacterales bacterium]
MPSAAHKTQFKKRQQAEFWHRINRLIFVLILVTICGLIFLSFYPELRRLQELRQNTTHLKQELVKKDQLLRDKTDEIQLLKNDPEYLETIARDRLDMMKDGETIYRLDGKVAPPAKSTKPTNWK